MSHVAWSVCLSACVCVGHTIEPSKNGWRDRDAVGSRLMWVQGTTRVQIPNGKGHFWADTESTGNRTNKNCRFRLAKSPRNLLAFLQKAAAKFRTVSREVDGAISPCCCVNKYDKHYDVNAASDLHTALGRNETALQRCRWSNWLVAWHSG